MCCFIDVRIQKIENFDLWKRVFQVICKVLLAVLLSRTSFVVSSTCSFLKIQMKQFKNWNWLKKRFLNKRPSITTLVFFFTQFLSIKKEKKVESNFSSTLSLSSIDYRLPLWPISNAEISPLPIISFMHARLIKLSLKQNSFNFLWQRPRNNK